MAIFNSYFDITRGQWSLSLTWTIQHDHKSLVNSFCDRSDNPLAHLEEYWSQYYNHTSYMYIYILSDIDWYQLSDIDWYQELLTIPVSKKQIQKKNILKSFILCNPLPPHGFFVASRQSPGAFAHQWRKPPANRRNASDSEECLPWNIQPGLLL